MYILNILKVMLFALVSMPVVAQSLSHNSPVAGTVLTLEDFHYAVKNPNSDKAIEVKTYMNGMQNFASNLYHYESEKPLGERPYCIAYEGNMFPTFLKPDFFYRLLEVVIKHEPKWSSDDKKDTSISGLVTYGLTKYYSCDDYKQSSHSPKTQLSSPDNYLKIKSGSTQAHQRFVFSEPHNYQPFQQISTNPFDFKILITGIPHPHR